MPYPIEANIPICIFQKRHRDGHDPVAVSDTTTLSIGEHITHLCKPLFFPESPEGEGIIFIAVHRARCPDDVNIPNGFKIRIGIIHVHKKHILFRHRLRAAVRSAETEQCMHFVCHIVYFPVFQVGVAFVPE